jgi:hypothetical protein
MDNISNSYRPQGVTVITSANNVTATNTGVLSIGYLGGSTINNSYGVTNAYGNVTAYGNVYSVTDIYASGNVISYGNVYAQGNVLALGNTISTGNVSALGNVYAFGNIFLTQSSNVYFTNVNYAAKSTDYFIGVRAPNVTVTIPLANTVVRYEIKLMSPGPMTITSPSPIDGSLSITCPIQNTSLSLLSDGVGQWCIV